MSWQLAHQLILGEAAGAPNYVLARLAGADDLDAILAIEAAAHPTPWPRGIFEGELELDYSSVWVFEQPSLPQPAHAPPTRAATDPSGGAQPTEIVGFLVFWRVHDEVHILNIAVAPRARRRGIASAVMKALIEVSTENLASFITLEVRINNKAAISLYESLGFVIIGQRPHYYADTGEDALIMSHLLS